MGGFSSSVHIRVTVLGGIKSWHCIFINWWAMSALGVYKVHIDSEWELQVYIILFHISPFCIYDPSCSGFVGELETLPAWIEWDVGQTLDRLPVDHRAKTRTEKQSHTYREYRVSTSLNWHVFELREKTAGNLCRLQKNLQTLLHPRSRFELTTLWIIIIKIINCSPTTYYQITRASIGLISELFKTSRPIQLGVPCTQSNLKLHLSPSIIL